MATKIQIRRDTAANWTSKNPTLASGEQGYEKDTGKIKIGDGLTAWTSLAYNFISTGVAGVSSVAGKTGAVTLVEGDIQNLTSDLAAKANVSSLAIYNIQDYGALTTASDNRATIQAALDAAYNAGGGVVIVPAGTYLFDVNPGLQVKTNVTLRGTGFGSILKLVNGSTKNDNMVKSESWTNAVIENITVDGNFANQPATNGVPTYTQYGIYIGSSTNAIVRNVQVKNTTGVGIHFYNSVGSVADSCFSTGNYYHGYEFEQDSGSHLISSRGYANRIHGLLVSPGEVNGSGSKGNSFIGNTFDGNLNYGIATNAANGDISAWLNEGDTFEGNKVINNSYYGVNFYKQDKQRFTNNYVANNGYFGLYGFESQDNIIDGNLFVNNSQAANGAYDEIMFEGYSSNSSHGSINNLIVDNKIKINGTNKARYAFNEGSTGDGNNTYLGNTVESGTAGTYNIIGSGSRTGHVDLSSDQTAIGGNKIFTTGFGVSGNSVTPSSALAGVDAPFGTSSPGRVYSKYGMQLVTGNGAFDVYVNEGGTQNNVVSYHNGYTDQHSYPIRNLQDPTNAQDAATKNYTDTNDALAVHKTGNETVAGTKTFSTGVLFPSTSTGVTIYNTTDQTTNYEKAQIFWNSNTFTILNTAGGTGNLRSIQIKSTGGTTSLESNSGTGVFAQDGNTTTGKVRILSAGSSGAMYGTVIGATFNNTASLMQTALSVQPTINQSGSSGYTGIQVNATETATGTGLKLLQDWQVGGVSKSSIDDTGKHIVQALQIGSTATAGYVLTTDASGNGTYQQTNVSSVTGTLPIANGGTGSSTQNFVDLTTAQTVGGIKTIISTGTTWTTGSVGQINFGDTNTFIQNNFGGNTVFKSGSTNLVINGQGGTINLQAAGTSKINISSSGVAINSGVSSTSTLQSVGSFSANTTIVTANTTLDATYYTLRSNSTSALTHTLPTAVGITGRIYVIKNVNTGAVTLATTSSQTIDGSTTYQLTAQYKFVTVQSNGTNWDVIGNN